MSFTHASWTDEMRSRFNNREMLTPDDCYHQFFEVLGLLKDDVMECLKLIELEFEIPCGLLRPSDKLSVLFTPVQTKNPWKWLVYRTREDDRQSELNYQLSKKLREHQTLDKWKQKNIETIEDLLYAWCGKS